MAPSSASVLAPFTGLARRFVKVGTSVGSKWGYLELFNR